jgi:hypothetical protein
MAVNQVLKPGVWNRGQPVPAPRTYKQIVEFLQQVIGPAAFLDQTGPLGPLNPALDRIFIETAKYTV